MFIKLSVILFVLQIGCAQNDEHDWELAVITKDKIDLLQSNGTVIGSTVQRFSNLKAITFDSVRHQFLVSDMDQENDTIYAVQLSKETDTIPIVQDLPDDVQGLAVDPIEDILYWTDTKNKTINFIGLNETDFEPQVLFSFDQKHPQGIALDVCKRYIYWTNSDVNHPTIERAKLDGTEHKVLIDSQLKMPAGITIDHKAQRLYWADKREGIYYRIESSNLDGTEREVVYDGTHTNPFGIAVDELALYWTDINNNALLRFSKHGEDIRPQNIAEYNEKPMGVIAKNLQIRNYPDCQELEKAIEKYGPVMEVYEGYKNQSQSVIKICLNDGESVGDGCKCKRGYTGAHCEFYACRDFCLNGDCHLSSRGYPQCHCPKGYGGLRCELYMCRDYCLNDGECSYSRGDIMPTCRCINDFVGRRCQIKAQFSSLCELYCMENGNGRLISTDNHSICRCNGSSYEITKTNISTAKLASLENGEDATAQLLSSEKNYDLFDKLSTDPAYLVQTALLVVSIAVIAILSVCICVGRRKRPTIKKRIIVNKNVTPLTYRPQPTTEQCEITIENCCNMNVCETPCFEPPRLRGKGIEDKKTLLSNMENGDDTY